MQSKRLRSQPTHSNAPESKTTRSQIVPSKAIPPQTIAPAISETDLDRIPPEHLTSEHCEGKSVKILLFGHRDEVQLTINDLQAIGFIKRVNWSLPMPISSAHGEYFSVTQYNY